MDQVYRIDNRLVKSGKWWNANFKYPCPVDSHNHELYQCGVFMGMSLKERHEKLKGRICRTCLKSGGVCLTKDKSRSSKVPKGRVCDGCTQYTQGSCPRITFYTAPVLDPSTPSLLSLSFIRPCRITLEEKLSARSLWKQSASECSCVPGLENLLRPVIRVSRSLDAP